MDFSELGLGPELLKAIAEAGYTKPTPIQEQAIPVALMCRDVLGLAQTGTGKTAAFTLPMIEILGGGRARARMPRSLILTPTRELAQQIAENFDKYGKYHKQLNKALLVGGLSMDEQIKILERGVDVLIATPGRLLDLYGRGNIIMADIKILVIDEADRMLDMGFIPDLEKIVSILPPLRQTLFFSATMPPPIKRLADQYLSNPKTITVTSPDKPAETVAQFRVNTDSRGKPKAFFDVLAREDVKNAFVFCNRKRDINGVKRLITQKGYTAGAMHGDMTQHERIETLQQFRDGKLMFLICSDVAARGLDVQGMSHVFNWDVPFHPEDYIHRIGRTGRAGMSGRAFTFVMAEERKAIDAVERLIGKPVPPLEGFELPVAGDPVEEIVPQDGRRFHGQDKNRDKHRSRGGGRHGSRDKGGKRHHSEHRAPEINHSNEEYNAAPPPGPTPQGFGEEMPAFFNKK